MNARELRAKDIEELKKMLADERRGIVLTGDVETMRRLVEAAS